jgi:hypothetical protein
MKLRCSTDGDEANYHSDRLVAYPVAVRISWAAKRTTTRDEDMAYCLLGIFDINMPMLYGEGAKAFLRLQEEIIKQCSDMSIFAWRDFLSSCNYTGLLAQSPRSFLYARGITAKPGILLSRCEFSVSNRGIRFRVPLGIQEASGFRILLLGHRDAKEN